jgi:ribonuclease Z
MRGSVLLLLAAAACHQTPDPVAGNREHDSVPRYRTRLVFLGTGNPFPSPERAGPATAVVVDDTAYLFDAGPGVVRRAEAAAEKLSIAALAPQRLGLVFITHLHSDHTLGYPDLMLTPWVIGREHPLEAYGPPGLAQMTAHLREAYQEDIDIRTRGLEHAELEPSTVNVHEIGPGIIYRDARVTITAFAVPHGSWAHALGYRIDGPDRSIVITGDHAPSDSIVEACNGCDVLVSEGYLEARPDSPEWRAYMRAFHTSTVELGELATKARAKSLVLTHRASKPRIDKAKFTAEVARGYAGPVFIPDDLDEL